MRKVNNFRGFPIDAQMGKEAFERAFEAMSKLNTTMGDMGSLSNFQEITEKSIEGNKRNGTLDRRQAFGELLKDVKK